MTDVTRKALAAVPRELCEVLAFLLPMPDNTIVQAFDDVSTVFPTFDVWKAKRAYVVNLATRLGLNLDPTSLT